MQSALSMCKVTPPSVTYRVHDPNSLGGPDSHVNPNETRVENNHDWKVLDVEIVEKERREDGHDGAVDEGEQWWERPISIAVKNKELAPRLSITDFIKIKPHALVLDIRGEIEFQRGHLPLSFNIQQSLLAMFGTTLKKLNMKYHVVLAKRDDAGPQFAADLVRIGFSRVGLLQGGLDAVRAAESRDPGSCPMCQCRPNKQTIASNTSNKGKVSEPSFVILRCKPKTGGTSGSSVKLAPAPPATTVHGFVNYYINVTTTDQLFEKHM
ncbi:hypothetical protein BC937DRAFT_94006 [Endogone sp. FLAS-F59071]|nr:hypothetical protein BC937DRAFT_94006 [Endogone sp. FLAS-F59071]|eukprot:RUS20934.1 hypothetical protein BC937DRAFT_94006 [Endogone sp. FLAS-F59071]